MSGKKDKPRHKRPAATPERAPLGCSKCKRGFDVKVWPRSEWTATGWSPWCPTCHGDFAPRKEPKAKSGPKPKAHSIVLANRWTNLPS